VKKKKNDEGSYDPEKTGSGVVGYEQVHDPLHPGHGKGGISKEPREDQKRRLLGWWGVLGWRKGGGGGG